MWGSVTESGQGGEVGGESVGLSTFCFGCANNFL